MIFLSARRWWLSYPRSFTTVWPFPPTLLCYVRSFWLLQAFSIKFLSLFSFFQLPAWLTRVDAESLPTLLTIAHFWWRFLHNYSYTDPYRLWELHNFFSFFRIIPWLCPTAGSSCSSFWAPLLWLLKFLHFYLSSSCLQYFMDLSIN